MHALCVRRFSNSVQIRSPGRKMRGQIPSICSAATLAVYQCKFVLVPECITAHVCRLISVNVDVINDRTELKCFTFNTTTSPFRTATIFTFTFCTTPHIFISFSRIKSLFPGKPFLHSYFGFSTVPFIIWTKF